MVDLDMLLPKEYNEMKPLGAMKLTTQKFYRVNGGATQLKGVIPDIILPDDYSYIEIGEKELDYPMEWDEIKPVYYKEWKLSTPLNKIQLESKQRTDTSHVFKEIKENAQRLKKNSDNTEVGLNLEKYRTEQKKLQEEGKKFENITSPIPDFSAHELQSEKAEMAADTAKAARAKVWFDEIDKDPYIYEAAQVVGDLQK
jgi:carboxyl-terminal processing protease